MSKALVGSIVKVLVLLKPSSSLVMLRFPVDVKYSNTEPFRRVFIQEIVGVGTPSALHLNSTLVGAITVSPTGSSRIVTETGKVRSKNYVSLILVAAIVWSGNVYIHNLIYFKKIF